MLCSCWKHGLPCVTACKNCNDTAYENVDVRNSFVTDGDDEITSLDFVDEHVQLPDQGLEYFMPWMYEEVVQSDCY